MNPDTIVIATFNRRHEAELAGGYLTDAGIAHVIAADDGGGAFGTPLTFSAGSFATVRVRMEDREEAERVLRDAGVLPE